MTKKGDTVLSDWLRREKQKERIWFVCKLLFTLPLLVMSLIPIFSHRAEMKRIDFLFRTMDSFRYSDHIFIDSISGTLHLHSGEDDFDEIKRLLNPFRHLEAQAATVVPGRTTENFENVAYEHFAVIQFFVGDELGLVMDVFIFKTPPYPEFTAYPMAILRRNMFRIDAYYALAFVRDINVVAYFEQQSWQSEMFRP